MLCVYILVLISNLEPFTLNIYFWGTEYPYARWASTLSLSCYIPFSSHHHLFFKGSLKLSSQMLLAAKIFFS